MVFVGRSFFDPHHDDWVSPGNSQAGARSCLRPGLSHPPPRSAWASYFCLGSSGRQL
jgi:hypothetical protein